MRALRVLLVEDNAMIAMALSEVLAGLGHSVCAIEETENGAVAAAALLGPDLLIVDERLREGGGAAAVAAILQSRFVPHILVSGDPVNAADRAQAAVRLRKPFGERDLIAAIESALDRAPAPKAT